MSSIKKISSNSGITLVALVITIIILLILAGVSISMIIGNNGIIKQEQEAKKQHEIGEYIDKIELARGEATLDKLGPITLDDLIDKINYKNRIEEWGIIQIDPISEEEAEAITKEGYVIKITEKGARYDRLETEPRLPNAPTISFVNGNRGLNEYYTSNVVLRITADNQNYIQKITYELSGAIKTNETTIQNGSTITISAEGTTNVTAYTYDMADNKSVAATYTVKKDSRISENADITITGPTTSNSLPVTLTARVTHSDAISGINIASCRYTFSNSSASMGIKPGNYAKGFNRNGQTINIQPTSPTSWYLHVLTVDDAGNAEETIKKIYISEVYHTHTGDSTSGGGCYGEPVPIYHSHVNSCYKTCTGKKYIYDTWVDDEGRTHYQALCNKCGAYEGKTTGTDGYSCGEKVVSCGKNKETIDGYSGWKINCGQTEGTREGYNISY